MDRPLHEEFRITWYRTPIDKRVLSGLMKRDDWQAFLHAGLHLLLVVGTGGFAYLAFLNIRPTNWTWSFPVLLFCLFWHGTFAAFLGGTATHELCHKTPFKNQALNDVFLHLFSFIGWFDPVAYRLSHVKHHQVTVHSGKDGELILPQKLDWRPLNDGEVALPAKLDRQFFVFLALHFLPFPDPGCMLRRIVLWSRYALGNLEGVGMFAGGVWWTETILPEEKTDLRMRHRNLARVYLLGHLALAGILFATGHWFLIVLVSCCGSYAGWLQAICGLPQHIGMGSDVPDFRLCCRTYTCSRLIGFLYWNMQYHVEHHMFPAVPFYNLPALRKAIQSDLPPASHGLWATWRGILEILVKQRHDSNYHDVPNLLRI